MRTSWGITTRLTLLTSAVATVAVLVAALLSVGLLRGAAAGESEQTLSREADLVAGAIERGRVQPWFQKVLDAQQVTIVRIDASGRAKSPNPAATAAADVVARTVVSGRSVSRRISNDWLVEGRPTGSGGVVLVQPAAASRTFGRKVLVRTSLALAVGLAVAVLAGLLLSQRSSRTLRRAAGAAHRLAGGDRNVRLPVEGPAEMAEVASALNTLAGALEFSEGRQREFLLGISHELRTPLTAISGFAESLRDEVVTGDEVPAVGETIHAEAVRLERLVGDLLDLARLDAVDFRLDLADVDLTELVSSSATVWQARCSAEGVVFGIELPPEPLTVRTDPVRVRQLLDGLAENALRVTPAGRPIVFALRTEDDTATPRPGETRVPVAVLEVRDGGPGLAPDDYAVAFERMALYSRYRGVRRVGTGLGLALVGRLTARLGGRAAAGPSPEGGAQFQVRLPA